MNQVMPANADAERSILGAVLLDNYIFHEAAAALRADDFSLDSHRRVFRAMEELSEAGKPIDILLMQEQLSQMNSLSAIGGVGYLASLTDGLPRRPSVEHYVQIVRDKSRLRMLVNTANNLISRAVEQVESSDDILADVQEQLIEIIYHGHYGSETDVRTAARQSAEMLTRIRCRDGRCIGCPTGLTELDELTTGFREKEFYVVGGRPAQGKTSWLAQAVRAQVQAGHRPGVFSIEIDRLKFLIRLACQEKRIPVLDTRDPRYMADEKFDELLEALAEIAQWKFFLDDTPRLSMKQMAAIARMWVSRGCDCIFVDYLQKLRAPGKGDFERVTYIADALWALARSIEVPVVALSQLSRKDSDEPPTLQDFRSSGEIEQNAAGAFAVFRPTGDDHQTFTGEDQFIILKQTSGPAGRHIRVRFNGPISIFEPRTL